MTPDAPTSDAATAAARIREARRQVATAAIAADLNPLFADAAKFGTMLSMLIGNDGRLHLNIRGTSARNGAEVTMAPGRSARCHRRHHSGRSNRIRRATTDPANRPAKPPLPP
jgi:hypothetical protein